MGSRSALPRHWPRTANSEPTALGRIVTAWPPLAFAVSFELLVIVLRDGANRTSPAAGGGASPDEGGADLVARRRGGGGRASGR